MHEVRRMPVFILHIAVVKRQSQIFLIRSWPCISFCSGIFFFHKIFKEPVRVFNCIKLYRNNKREFQIYKSQRERIMNKGEKNCSYDREYMGKAYHLTIHCVNSSPQLVHGKYSPRGWEYHNRLRLVCIQCLSRR